MSKLQNIGGFAGYGIGAILIVPLLLFGYNYFFINKNDADKYLKYYMTNSKEVLLSVPSPMESNLQNDKIAKTKSFTTSMASKNMGRDGSSSTTLVYRLVLDSVSKKYYQITMLDLFSDFWIALNGKVYGRVNNDDLANPGLGTKERPFLVFSVRGIEGSMVTRDIESRMIDFSTSAKQYKYNIFMYLTYVMTKEEFKERFEKKK